MIKIANKLLLKQASDITAWECHEIMEYLLHHHPEMKPAIDKARMHWLRILSGDVYGFEPEKNLDAVEVDKYALGNIKNNYLHSNINGLSFPEYVADILLKVRAGEHLKGRLAPNPKLLTE